MTNYGRSEELVSRCIECDLAEPESLASLGGSAPGLVDGILSMPRYLRNTMSWHAGGGLFPSSSISVVVEDWMIFHHFHNLLEQLPLHLILVMEFIFIWERNSIITKIFFELVKLLDSLQLGDRIPPCCQSSQTDKHHHI